MISDTRNPARFFAVLSLACLPSFLAARAEEAAPAGAQASGSPAHQIGEPAPVFQLRIVNNQEGGPRLFDMRSYVGDDAEKPAKLLLVSFFATWCKPCKAELPELVRLAATYKDAGLQVVSIAIDKDKADIDKIPDIVKANSVIHPVISDSMNIVARRYLGSDVKLPSLVMVNHEGNIVSLHQGYGDDLKASLEGEIRQKLGLPAADGVATQDKAKHKKHADND